MATTTLNYNLNKPDEDDFYDINMQNFNMDIIDEELKKRKEEIEKSSNLVVIKKNEEIAVDERKENCFYLKVTDKMGQTADVGDTIAISPSLAIKIEN